jgi:alkanesulfonate monooxygenase SsuD/methylene tetrahydromethanopterin reductase-like flavin-dependent oxidoreductase (luciferase family)
VIRALRDERMSTFDGHHYRLRDARMDPKPAGPMPREAIGRDPATLRRSTQALVILGRDPVPDDGLRAIGGSVERLRDTFGRYAAAGADESSSQTAT